MAIRRMIPQLVEIVYDYCSSLTIIICSDSFIKISFCSWCKLIARDISILLGTVFLFHVERNKTIKVVSNFIFAF